uniref:Cytochrome b6-f complex subunit PetP n=1 Tax=Dasyclonium flaccidum TaxID=2007274 RepID=A0A1Z1ML47_9FLOR|nr:cytochrome b6-f complex subunit PetP [Dasyclonium flaccidum]ARW66656.1 cytochrome b6-f complex subunit PetP [Dasyclonium flaccidum]
MNKSLIHINRLPTKIRIRITRLISSKLYFIGYKKISNKYKVPIIQLQNSTRIWMLKKEIKFNIK